jgi:hypothetical protein
MRRRRAADDVVGATAEEARRQGLTVEDAKAAAGEFSVEAGRVVMRLEYEHKTNARSTGRFLLLDTGRLWLPALGASDMRGV